MRTLSTHRVGQKDSGREHKRAGAPLDPFWILRIVRRGWRVLLGAALGGLAIGAVLAFVLVRSTWEAQAVLVPDVEPDPANPFASDDALHEGVELIEHPSVLAIVRRRLGSRGTIESYDARIDAEADREAGAIRLRTRSDSRAGAAGLGAIVIQSFLAQRRESEAERLAERARRRRDELAAAERNLASARREYDTFRAEHGIADLEEEREHAIQEVARLSAEADEASVAIVTSEARMEVLRREARRMPRMQTLSAQSTDRVRGGLAEARAELARARAAYTEEHPAVQALLGRIASLERERRSPSAAGAVALDATMGVNPIREELEGGVALAAADRATAAEQQVGLRRLAELARERVRALSAIEGQASLLLAAVRVGEQQVEALRTDIAQAEDRMGNPPAGYHVSAPAIASESPMPSRERKLALIGPPLVGLLIAFGFLFWRERGGPQIRSAVEIAWWGRAPVIGTTTWPDDPRALDLLVAELEDLGTYAAGRTLVVPATEDEKDLAVELAAKLAEAPWLAAGVLDIEPALRSRRLAAPAVTTAAPVRRPTLPMPSIVTPPPENEEAEREALGESDSRDTVIDLEEREADPATPHTRREEPARRLAATEGVVGGGEEPPRRSTARFARAEPSTVVGPDVRVGSILAVGGDRAALPAASIEPAASGGPTRAVHVRATIDVEGQARSTRFELDAEAPQERDAVMMLAMRILGDGRAEGVSPARMLELEPAYDRFAHRPSDPSDSRSPGEQAAALAWTGRMEGPTLRRAARLADRVIVLVREGTLTPADLARLQTKLGREDAIGILVVGAEEDEVNQRRDRLGDVVEFWTARKRLPG